MVKPAAGRYTSTDMSKTGRGRKARRSPTDLEVLLLALVSRGLTSPYEFKARAGISPGASLPALARLRADDLVTPGAAGARGKIGYSLTAKGRNFLQSSWKDLFQRDPAGDLDTILRTAALATAMGATKSSISKYLQEAAKIRAQVAGQYGLPAAPGGPTESYRWMRSFVDPERVKAEARALRHIAKAARKVL